MLYIILPIYNEAKIIQNVIDELRMYLKKQKYQIVAVDDGSTDGSTAILKKNVNSDFTYTGYSVNMNIGSVFATGIDKVLETAKDTDILIIMESDQTSSVDVIGRLVKKIENGADTVIASRYLSGGGYGNFPIMRRIFSVGANALMKYYFPIDGVQDYTIFFRAYRVGILRNARELFGKFGIIQSKGFVANAELLVKISFITHKIVEIPFIYDYGKKTGKSKITIPKTINEYFVVITYLKAIHQKIEQRGLSKR